MGLNKLNRLKSKKNKLFIVFFLILTCTFLTSIAQLLLKKGMTGFELLNILELGFINPYVIAGAIIYILAAIVFIHTLKKEDLSIVFPFTSLSFVWVTLLSLLILGELINLFQSIGIIIIVAGVSFIGWGARNA